MDVGEATTRLVPGVPPNVTEVAPVKFVPVMTTVVPPVVKPVFGETEVIVGVAPEMVIVWVVLVRPVAA